MTLEDTKRQVREMFFIGKKKIPQIAEKLNIDVSLIEKWLKDFAVKVKSHGENDLLEALKKIYTHKIETQFRIGQYYFDIYIPKMRLLFEVDGVQHYEYTSFFQGQGSQGHINFDYQQKADRIKDKLARDNHLYLIRIPYTMEINETNLRRIINEHMDQIHNNLVTYMSETGYQ